MLSTPRITLTLLNSWRKCLHREEIRVGWELVEHHIQVKDWVEAARVLSRSMRIIEQEEMKQIGAISDIRLFLTDLHSVMIRYFVDQPYALLIRALWQKFHIKVIDELHRILYRTNASRQEEEEEEEFNLMQHLSSTFTHEKLPPIHQHNQNQLVQVRTAPNQARTLT